MYHIDVKHEGLRKSRRLSGADLYVLQQRARLQSEAWDARWRKFLRQQQEDESLRHLPNFQAQKVHADRLSAAAQLSSAAWANILTKGLEAPAFKMEMLYDSRIYPEPRPVLPAEQETPDPPNRNDPSFNYVPEFQVMAEFWALFLPRLRLKREKAAQAERDAAQARYDTACRNWQEATHEVARQNAKAKIIFDMELDAWWARAQAYQKQQQDENARVDRFRQRYAQRDVHAVLEFVDAALAEAEYPNPFPMQWNMGFQSESGALIMDYELPPPDDFPGLKAVKYDVMQDSFEQIFWSQAEIAKLYEDAIYQTCLRTLHDVFAADAADAIASITFNGWVNFTDKVHGRPARACILSVKAGKAAVQQASSIVSDPKAGFQALKGIAGSHLAEMTEVIPVASLQGADYRLVETVTRKGA